MIRPSRSRKSKSSDNIVRSRLLLERLECRELLANFTPGNLVIYRVGDGAGALTSLGSRVFLDEYTPTGAFVQSVPMPSTSSGGQFGLLADASNNTEGLLSRSANKQFLMLTGYEKAATAGSLSASGTTLGQIIRRVVGRVDYAGQIDTRTTTTNYSDVAIRAATSTNGTTFWMTGGNDGLRTSIVGSANSNSVSNTPASLRNLEIYGNQLYVSNGNSAAFRVGTVGTGTPTGSATIANLPLLPATIDAYGYFLADLTSSVAGFDTLYVADPGIGIRKYSLVSGVWTATGTVGSGADSIRGLTGIVTGTTVALYATGRAGTGAAGGGQFLTVTDTSGYNTNMNGTLIPLVTATANTAFRGIALAPEPPSTVYVDDTWSGTLIGRNPVNDPVGGLVFGSNAFADVQQAINAVAPGGNVVVFGGLYTNGFNVNKPVTFDVQINLTTPLQNVAEFRGSTIILSNSTTFNQFSTDLIFNATIDALTIGGASLTVNSGAQDTYFNGTIGGTEPLFQLTTDLLGRTFFGAPSINTTGNQNYFDPVLLNADTTLVGPNLLLDNGLRLNNGSFTLGHNGVLTLNGNVVMGVDKLTINSIGASVGTIRDQVIGTGGFGKDGPGQLILLSDSSYNGMTTITGGILQLGNGGFTGAIGPDDIVNDGELRINRLADLTLVNNISGTGIFTNVGLGTTTMTGVSTYTGDTTVFLGGLIVDGSVNNSHVIVKNFATLSGNGSTGAITIENGAEFIVGTGNPITFRAYGNVDIAGRFTLDMPDANSIDSLQVIGGTVTLAPGTSRLTINYTGSVGTLGSQPGDFYTLIDNDDTTDLVTGAFFRLLVPPFGPVTGPDFTIDGKPFRIYYNGGDGNDVIIVHIPPPPIVYVDDDWSTLLPGFVIRDADPATPGNQPAVFGYNAFASIVTATGVSIPGADIYINDGDYSTEAVNLVANRRLILLGTSTTAPGTVTIGSLTGSTGTTINLGYLNVANTLQTGADNSTTTYPGTLTGVGNLTKQGNGTFILSNNNPYSGTTTISGGILQLGDAGPIGAIGSGPIINNATLSINRTNAITLANAISGTGNLGNVGTGVTTLSGISTYTGTTTVLVGTLLVTGSIGNSAVLVQNTATLGGNGTTGAITSIVGGTIAPGTSTTPGTLSANGNLITNGTLNIDLTSLLVYDRLNVTGTVTIGPTATLNITFTGAPGSLNPNGAQIFTLVDNDGATDLISGTFVGLPNQSQLTIDGLPFQLFYNAGDGNDIILAYTPPVTNTYVDDNWAALTTGFFIPDADPVTSGDQPAVINYNAFSTITNGINVAASGFSVFVNAGTYNEAITITDNKSVVLLGVSDTTSGIVSIGSLAGNVDTGVNVGYSGLSNTLRVGTNNTNTTYAGIISGAGKLEKVGVGTLTLIGDNTYSDNTTILGGILQIGNGGTSGTLGTALVVTSSILAFNRSDTLTVPNTINGTGLIRQIGIGTTIMTANNGYSGGTTISAGTLQVGDGGLTGTVGSGSVVNNSALVFNRSNAVSLNTTISGNGVLTQAGTGTTVLTGNSTYTGATFVANGSLLVDGSITSKASTAIGTTLGGNGTIEVGNVVFGSTLSPGGGGLGTLHVVNNLSLDAALAIQLGTANSFDTLAVVGTVTLNPTAILNVVATVPGTFDPPAAQSFTIIDNDGSDPIVGTFSGLPQGASLTIGGLPFQIFYDGGDGNDVVLIHKPAVTLAYVDDSWAGLSLNDVIVDTDPVTPGNQPGIIGYNAFSSINAALGVIPTTGSVLVNAGTYNETVNLQGSQLLRLLGINASTPGTVILGSLAGGTSTLVDVGYGNLGNTLRIGSNNASTVFAGSIDGIGGVTKEGSGSFTLTNSNTYTGPTTILSGSFQLGDGGALGSINNGAIVNSGTLIINRNAAFSMANAISGSGSLIQQGTGQTILTGANTYTGTTNINAGTLQIGNSNTTGTIGTGAVTNNGTLIFRRSNTLMVSANISGSGNVIQVGTSASTTILTGTNTYTGSTTIVGGILQVGNSGAQGTLGLGAVSNTSGLVINRTGSLTIPGVISGTGPVTQLGTGTTILTGNNTSTGAFTISAGTIQLGNGGTTGSLGAGTLVNNANLAFNRSDVFQFSHSVSGTGTLTQAGPGTTVLTGTNINTGSTFINQGTLQIGNGSTIGTLGTAPVVNNGNLSIYRSDAFLFPNNVSGNGSVNLTTTATLMTGSNTYSGTTNILAGSLFVGSSNAISPTTALVLGTPNSAISGSFDLNGFNITVTGLSLATGNTAGEANTVTTSTNSATLTVANTTPLVFGGRLTGSNLAFVKAGPAALTLSGTNTNGGPTTINSGILYITGSVPHPVLVVGGGLGGTGSSGTVVGASGTTLEPGTSVGNFTINGDLNLAGTLKIEFSPSGVSDQLFLHGGTANLGATASLSLIYTGTPGTFDPSGRLIYTIVDNDGTSDPITGTFAGLPNGSTVTVDGISFRIEYNSGDGNDIVLISGMTPTVSYVDDNWNSLTNGQFIQDADPVAPGNQTAIFGLNAFSTINAALLASTTSATIFVNAGTYPENVDLGSTQTLTLLGVNATTPGTVSINSLSGVSATKVNLGYGNLANTLNTGADGSSTTFDGLITGVGHLTKDGVGTMILGGDNTYSGSTTISGGALQVGNGGTTGTLGTGSILNNAALFFNRTDSFNVAGVISGTGSLTQGGTGTTTLLGNNSYTGSTFIVGGALQIGNGGTTGTLGTGSLVNNSLLIINRADQITIAGNINGGGSFTQQGIGTTILTGTNTYAGPTTINAGILQLGNGGTAGSVTSSAINNQGTLVINRSDAFNLSTSILGSGALEQVGTGITTISGTNSYTGETRVLRGTLKAGSFTALPGATTLTLGTPSSSVAGTFDLNGFNTIVSGLSIATGNTAGLGNTITDTAGPAVFTVVNTTSITYEGTLSGAGLSFAKGGTGTFTLTSNNNYGGSTTVNAGSLILTGSITSPVTVNGGTLGGTGSSGAVSVATGGVVSPGTSPGTFTVNGSYIQNGNLTVEFASESNFDVLKVVGTVLLGSSSTLTVNYIGQAGAFTPAGNPIYTILDNDGSDPVQGKFAGMPDGTEIDIDSQTFRIFYNSGDGNDVILLGTSAVPSIVYVDDNWASLGDGNLIPDADPVAPGNQPGVIGSNAFGTISQALAKVAATDGTVVINPGTYAENVAVTKTNLTMYGNGPLPSSVVIDPLVGNGLTITADNAKIRNLQLTGGATGLTASNVTTLTLENLQVVGNSASGINLSSISGLTSFTGVTITGNGNGGSLSHLGSLKITGTPQDDVFTASGSLLQYNAGGTPNQTLSLDSIATLNLLGGEGMDTFNITPSTTTFFDIDAGNPDAWPGDVLSINSSGATNPLLTDFQTGSSHSGQWTFDNRQAVSYSGIESFGNVKVAIVSVPSTLKSGETFAVSVQLRDSVTNTLVNFSGPVYLRVNSGPGTLSGTTTINVVNGQGTFDDLRLDRAGTYSLRAVGSGFQATASTFINVTATSIAFSVVPGSVRSSMPGLSSHSGFTVQVVARDTTGNVATNFNGLISLSVNTGLASAFGGTLQVRAVNGVATFNTLYLSRAGNYRLTAFTPGFGPVGSTTITSTANRLVIRPATGTTITTLSAPVQVLAVDAQGYLCWNFNGQVTIYTAVGPAVLQGTTVAQAVRGIATFNDLFVTVPGTYRFQARTMQRAPTTGANVDGIPPDIIAGPYAIATLITEEQRGRRV